MGSGGSKLLPRSGYKLSAGLNSSSTYPTVVEGVSSSSWGADMMAGSSWFDGKGLYGSGGLMETRMRNGRWFEGQEDAIGMMERVNK